MDKSAKKVSFLRLKKRGMSILLTLAMIFGMLPMSTLAEGQYTADFLISDTNGAVAGAEITIGSDTETTGSDGKAQFYLQAGAYSYSVIALGRVAIADGSININNGNITENVALSTDPAGATISITGHIASKLQNELDSFMSAHSLTDSMVSGLSVSGGELDLIDQTITIQNLRDSLKNSIKRVDFSQTSFLYNDVYGGIFSYYPVLSEVVLPDSVTDIGSQAFFGCTGLRSITLPPNVTKIGSCAFYSCTKLESITLPSGVTQIGSAAFEGCTSLTSITLPSNVDSIEVSTFGDCTSLASVTLPSNATNIGINAFLNCTSLTSINLQETKITTIGSAAFRGCTSLTYVTLPSAIENIGIKAFYECSKLIDITLPSAVPPQYVEITAFDGISHDAVVHVPGGSSSAYRAANDFNMEDNYWYKLYIDDPEQAPVLSNGWANRISDTVAGVHFLMDIRGDYYYAIVNDGDAAPDIDTTGPGVDCSDIQVYIPITTLTPGAKDFYVVARKGDKLSNTLKIDISAYMKPFDMVISNHTAGSLAKEIDDYLDSHSCSGAYNSIGSLKVTGGALNAEDQDYIYNIVYEWHSILKIDFSETSFEYSKANDNVMMGGLFSDIQPCDTIILPEGISAISDEAFKMCSNLRNITIPSSVTSIGNGAFFGCIELNAIIIPAGVTDIGEYAFEMCNNLESVTIRSAEPPAVGEGCFGEIAKGAAVYVPKGSASAYKAAADGNTADDLWYGLLVDDGTGTDKRITKVQTINIIVPWGTSKAGIGLPEKVNITLNDGSTMKLEADWDDGNPAYNGNKEGIYFFIGTFKNLPDGIKNDINKTAQANILVEALKSAEISPAAFSFDLDAPKDMVSAITWNNASTVTEVVYESGSPQSGIDYTVNGDELTIGKDDILALNPKEGDYIPFEVSFNMGDSAKVTMDIVKSYQPGADASLKALKIWGNDLKGFDPETYSYEIKLPEGIILCDLTAVVSATPRDPKARVEVTPALALPGSTKVEVTAEDGTTKKTYTVNFTALTYTVTFNKNGGDTEANPSSKTVADGESLGTLPTAPARSGYTFNGWNTKADGSGTAFTGAMSVMADITVYAQWKANSTNDGGSNHHSGSSGGGGRTNTTSTAALPQNIKIEVVAAAGSATAIVTVPSASGQSGKMTAAVTGTKLSSAISQVVTEAAKQSSGSTARVEIKVEAPADVTTVEVSITKEAVDLAADGRIETLTVSTPAAAITFDSQALDAIASQAAADIKITAERVNTQTLSEDMKQVVGDRPVYDFSVTSGDKVISQFGENASVSVSIPYAPKPGEDINAIVIYYINAEGKPEIVRNCAYDQSTGTISFITNHFSKYAVGYNKVSFKDVPASAWYSKAVSFLAARNITTGTGNGNFNPEAKLTRGEFMVMLMKAYGMAADTNPKDNFADSGDTYYTGYLAAAKRLGISDGIGNNLFAPDKEITRQEMSTLLYNALKAAGKLPAGTSEKQLPSFSDAGQISSWAKKAMTLLVETGTIDGNSGKLSPVSTTTRAEMAQVLYNLLAK